MLNKFVSRQLVEIKKVDLLQMCNGESGDIILSNNSGPVLGAGTKTKLPQGKKFHNKSQFHSCQVVYQVVKVSSWKPSFTSFAGWLTVTPPGSWCLCYYQTVRLTASTESLFSWWGNHSMSNVRFLKTLNGLRPAALPHRFITISFGPFLG